MLSLWLRDLGDVRLDARIAGHSRRGDVLFKERRHDPALRAKLGTLGELSRGEVLFEPYRNAPTPLEFKSCVMKVVDLEAHEAREARRLKQPLSAVRGPSLCVITPRMSPEFAEAVGAHPRIGATPGVYALPPIWRVFIIAVNELPISRSTLWLRLLGRDAVQIAAIQEIVELTDEDPLLDATIRLLMGWKQSLPSTVEPREDDAELNMNLERVYERWEKKIEARARRVGKTEGKIEGKAAAVLANLENRGLTVTPEQRKLVLTCTDNTQIDAWLRDALTTSSAELLLSGPPAPKVRAKRR